MEDQLELVLEPGQHAVVGDRALDELHPVVGGHALALGREQVVDHEHRAPRRASSRARTRFDPTNPAPPTTSAFLPPTSLMWFPSMRVP